MAFEASHNRMEIRVGFFVVVGFIYLVYVALEKWNLLDPSGYIIYADFASVSGLHVGDPVEIAGVRVVKVEFIRLADYQPV
jgi:phospholipid/cholesterol/gamma-HCH transport system substrate-binding protein